MSKKLEPWKEYNPVEWVNGETPLSAENLKQMDNRIVWLNNNKLSINDIKTLSGRSLIALNDGEDIPIKTLNGMSIFGKGDLDFMHGSQAPSNMFLNLGEREGAEALNTIRIINKTAKPLPLEKDFKLSTIDNIYLEENSGNNDGFIVIEYKKGAF